MEQSEWEYFVKIKDNHFALKQHVIKGTKTSKRIMQGL